MLTKVLFPVLQSNIIQIGIITREIIAIYPNGLISTALKKSPFMIEMTERVVPQDGQGICRICFDKHPCHKPCPSWLFTQKIIHTILHRHSAISSI